MNTRILAAALVAAALTVPAAATAHPGHGKGPEKHAAKAHEKGKHGKPKHDKAKHDKTVKYVFKGTFTAPGTVAVTSGNRHVRKGGFVGQAVTFDFASAKVVAADTNGDQKVDVADVKDGDAVLVQARVAKKTQYEDGAAAIVARKLVDKTNPPARPHDGAESTDDAPGKD
jgi:hypothetical protein